MSQTEIIIEIIIFFLAWNEYDFLLTQPKYSMMNLFLKEGSKKYKWYFENRYNTKSWWLKNVFVFLQCGQKLNSSTWRAIAYYWISHILYQDWRTFALTVALWVFTGTIHSIQNGTLFGTQGEKDEK